MSVHGSTAQTHSAYAALLTLVLYSLVRSGEALAGDQLFMDDAASKSDAAGAQPRESASLPSPLSLSLDRHDGEFQTFSATEFRPRVRAQTDFDEPARASIIGDKAAFEGTAWQRLAEYKSQDRLRLLTLWQTRGSTLSLQAGKHGGPSLQWSSPWLMRDGSSSGLFDRLLSVPLRGISTGSRNAAVRPAAEPPKPLSLSSSAAGAP